MTWYKPDDVSESYDFSGVSARAAWCIAEGMPGNHFGNVTGFKFEREKGTRPSSWREEGIIGTGEMFSFSWNCEKFTIGGYPCSRTPVI